jgi:hypothetical protein
MRLVLSIIFIVNGLFGLFSQPIFLLNPIQNLSDEGFLSKNLELLKEIQGKVVNVDGVLDFSSVSSNILQKIQVEQITDIDLQCILNKEVQVVIIIGKSIDRVTHLNNEIIWTVSENFKVCSPFDGFFRPNKDSLYRSGLIFLDLPDEYLFFLENIDATVFREIYGGDDSVDIGKQIPIVADHNLVLEMNLINYPKEIVVYNVWISNE